jgi:hypothetical protein
MYSVSGHVKLLNSWVLALTTSSLGESALRGAETRALESHRDQSFDLSNLNTLSLHSHSHSRSNYRYRYSGVSQVPL